MGVLGVLLLIAACSSNDAEQRGGAIAETGGSGGATDTEGTGGDDTGSGGSSTGGVANATGGRSPSPRIDPLENVPNDVCVIEHPPFLEDYGGYFLKRTWDPEQRLFTEIYDEEGDFGGPGEKSAYTPDGRIIYRLSALAVALGHVRTEYGYDDGGNLVSIRAGTTYGLDESVIGHEEARESYTHEYDDTGRLVSSTHRAWNERTGDQPEVRYVYEEDEEGRCARIESTKDGETSIETQTYAEGRIAHIEVRGARSAVVSTEDFTYDDQGRLLTRALVQTIPTSEARSENESRIHDYRGGSQGILELINITYDGWGYDDHFDRTPGCRAIEQAIAAHDDLKCRVRVPRDKY